MSGEREGSDLRALLELERACCARLLPILDAERGAAASYDHVALLACLHERETLQAEWQQVARRRRESLRDAGTTIASLIGDDPLLASVVADLKRDAARVRRAQRINEGVVRAALAHVTDTLTVIRRELPDSRYDERAALRAPMPAAGRWSA